MTPKTGLSRRNGWKIEVSIFLDGRPLAVVEGGQVFWLHWDHILRPVLATDAATVEAALGTVRQAGAPEARFLDTDLREEAAIDAMMEAVADWGGADVLVNNAGIQKTVPLAEASAEIWNAILAVNLSAAFHTMRLALPVMAGRGYGRVVNIASVHGLVASKHKAPYVSAKFGLVGLSRVAALEYAPQAFDIARVVGPEGLEPPTKPL